MSSIPRVHDHAHLQALRKLEANCPDCETILRTFVWRLLWLNIWERDVWCENCQKMMLQRVKFDKFETQRLVSHIF